MTATLLPALAPRTDFLGLDGVTHLYTAAECPMLGTAEAALLEYARQKSRGEAGRARHADVVATCKSSVATLLGGGARAEDIAFVSSSSDGINQVCSALGLGPGDNVVVNNLEFPSVLLPWLRLRDRGVEVRVVEHRDWNISTEALLAAVDARTRVLALSHVSFVNGLRHDAAAIGWALRGTQTLFLLDATQSLGVLPVPAAAADFIVSSTYKWLLGTHGLGVLYWNRARRPELADLQPGAVGWYSISDTFAPIREQRYDLKPDAGRFETGFVSFPAIYALGAAVPYLLDAGQDRVAAHALSLGGQLLDGLEGLGLEVMTPRAAERRGASVSFAHRDATQIGLALAERGIYVWAGDGRVRASTHLFNDSADVETYLEAVTALVRAAG